LELARSASEAKRTQVCRDDEPSSEAESSKLGAVLDPSSRGQDSRNAMGRSKTLLYLVDLAPRNDWRRRPQRSN
jgi:hypothetical protein